MKIPDHFRAFYVDENHNGAITDVPFEFLPDHEVVIEVQYSSLNYKDALSATGKNNVTRIYPHIPGIDASGIVIGDTSETFNQGDVVLVTGFDLGTNTSGGFGRIIRVPAEWVIPVPDSMTAKQAMMIGTAGFTAVYGIKRLQREQILTGSGPVLVTGATGGVGSFAVFGLAQLGYEVIASTRKEESYEFLNKLGAKEILPVDTLLDSSTRPLLTRKWSGAIETVGGELLDSVLRQTEIHGAVACCGNILGMKLQTNVLPFILRGISLLGIDSAGCQLPLRNSIWETISEFDLNTLPENYYKIVGLNQLPQEIDKILNGKQSGRVVISHE